MSGRRVSTSLMRETLALALQLSPSDRSAPPTKTKYHTRAEAYTHRRRSVSGGDAGRQPISSARLARCSRRIKRPRLTWRSVRSSPTIRWTVASFRGAVFHGRRPSSTAVNRCGKRSREKVRSTASPLFHWQYCRQFAFSGPRSLSRRQQIYRNSADRLTIGTCNAIRSWL